MEDLADIKTVQNLINRLKSLALNSGTQKNKSGSDELILILLFKKKL